MELQAQIDALQAEHDANQKIGLLLQEELEHL